MLPLLFLLAAAASAQTAPAPVPGPDWPRLAAPGQAGWSTEKLAAAQAYVEELGSTSALVVHHGAIVAAWGDIAHKSNLHSCRKSLLDALIGIAVAEGRIRLTDSLAQLGIDDNEPALTAVEKQATVGDLLASRSGVYHPTVYETKSMKAAKPARGSHPPGAFWYYNNWDFNTLGAIYEKAAGQGIFDAFHQKIARPIGMQDFHVRDGKYVTGPETRYPAYPFDMSARDLARFALLFLRGGNWNGTQIVPESWVKASTRPYSDTSSGGYGYLWWTGDSTTGAPRRIAFPTGSYWAEGHLGQFAVVVPSRDLIVVNRVDGRQTDRTVGKQQMARLVRLVLAAAPPK